MRKKLPYGALRSCRRRYMDGSYGSYVTWKMLRVFATILANEKEDSNPWTARELAYEVGMSLPGMRRLLARARKNGIVKYGKDKFGRKAWVITSDGFEFLWKEVNRRVRFSIKKNQTVVDDLIKIVLRAMDAIRKLKRYGFKDIEAREILINYSLERVEWALRTAYRQRRVIFNETAYVRSLIRYGDQQERRCRKYISAVNYALDEDVKDFIVKKAMETPKPINAVKLVMKIIKRRVDVTTLEIGEIFYNLYRSKAIIYKPYRQHSFVAV
jgi:DNA-binding transcriptional regulator GbsR (MarR family)